MSSVFFLSMSIGSSFRHMMRRIQCFNTFLPYKRVQNVSPIHSLNAMTNVGMMQIFPEAQNIDE